MARDLELRRASQRAAQRRYWARHKQKYRDFAAKARARNWEWLRAKKAGLQCSRCGESDPVVLDFHHERDKDREIATAANQGWSIARLEREFAKCIVLCANCHRRHHAAKRST